MYSNNLGQIGIQTTELSALEHSKIHPLGYNGKIVATVTLGCLLA